MLLPALVPRYGAPDFRYTGSNPNQHVWNFGWPIATCTFDSATMPYWFIGPFAYVFATAEAVLLVMAYAAIMLSNNRGFLKSRTKRVVTGDATTN